jgi:hypothetical protein
MTTARSTLNPLRLTAALLLFGIGVSQAQQLLYTPPGSGTWRDNANEANGTYFVVGSANVVVSHMGYFSTNTTRGLASHHQVGVYSGNYINSSTVTNLSILRQVDVSAGNTNYFYQNAYWVQLDPPMVLSANTGYLLAAQGYNLDGDWWIDASTVTFNSYFVGTTATGSRFAAYGPNVTTWPLSGTAVFTRNGLNKTYVMPLLGNLPQGPAKVGLFSANAVFVTGNQTLTLNGYATGANTISYQWWQNGVPITGQTTATLSIPNAWDTNSGTYYLTATNSLGGQQSANISVTVYTYPIITSVAPQTSGQTQTLFAGGTANFAVTGLLGAPPFSYQWLTNGVADVSVTSSNYVVTNVQSSSPTTFACVVTNVAGAATNTWTISVVPHPTAPYPATVLADSPIGYWRLNDPDNSLNNGNLLGVANDYWGGNSGVYSNTVLNQTGYGQDLATQYGYTPATDSETSALFRNYPTTTTTNSYVANINNVGFGLATNNYAAFSIEAWVKGPTTQISGAGVVEKGYGSGGEQFNLDVYGNAFRFFVRDVAGGVHGPTSTFQNDGNWHHVVGVVDEGNSNVTLYVDSTFRWTSACSPSNGILASTAPVTIGARRSSSTSQYDNQFAGNVNDVAIYNYALSSNQVFNHYTAAGIGAHFLTKPIAATNMNQAIDLTVAATVVGTLPVNCQWYDVTGGFPGTALANQTNATLFVGNIQAADFNGHVLSLVTSNAFGQASNQVALTVYSVPFFTQQPPAALSVYAGNAGIWNLSVATVGPQPIGYTWLSNGVPIAFANSATLSITNPQVSAVFSCWATNALGSSTSTVATLTVVPQPSAAYPVAVLGDHPLGYWRLNEANNGSGNTGVAANDYWGGNYGIYTNTILGQPGYSLGLSNQFGYTPPATDPTETSAQFGYYTAAPPASKSNYVAGIPNINFAITNASSTFSIEAWASGDTNQDASGVNGAGIVAKGAWAAEQFTLDTGGTAYAYRFTTRDANNTIRTASNTNNIPDSKWHHLVGVLDQVHSNLYLYVDGVRVAATLMPTATNGVLGSAVPVSIGSRLSSGGGYGQQFFGNINDVAIYNYALSSNQVAAHYVAAGVPPKFTVQPPTSTNVNEGATLVVSVQALGSPNLSYQWYDTTTSTAIPGQTNPNLVLSNISQAAYNGHMLAVTVSNIYGLATSSSVTLNVSAGPPNTAVITPEFPPTMYAGLVINFTVEAQGTQPFGYVWTLDNNPAPGAGNSAVYAYTNILGSHTIQCTVTNSLGTAMTPQVSVSGVVAPTDTYATQILNDQPVAFLRLDESAGAGVAYDYVGGHDAYYYNAVNGLPGFSPSYAAETATGVGMNGVTSSSLALEYDQSGSGIPNIDFSTQGANAHFSVEVWVNAPAGQANGAGILAKGYGNGGEQFSLDSYGGHFRFYVHNAANNATRTAQSSNLGPDGTWHHLVAVCDEAGGSVRLYVDGALNASGTMVPGEGLLGPLPVSGSVLTSIGSRMSSSTDANYSNQLINGKVAQVALYNYVLSPSQISTHYLTAAEPPSIYIQPSPASFKRYQGPALQYTTAASGHPPLAYQWYKDGAPISGQNGTSLSFASVQPADSGAYEVVVTNVYGAATSTVASLTVLGPTTAYENQLLTVNPVYYWRFNETNGTTAYDYIGGLNGTYGASTTNGVPGPSSPDFTGFETNNVAVAMDHALGGSTTASYVTTPALNISNSTVTLIAWVYPFSDITNYQGVLYTRASTYSKGINYISIPPSRLNMVGYTWNQNNGNTYGWQSGLVTPPGQWSFVALTIAPTRAIMYVGNNGVLTSATNAIAHDSEAFNGTTMIGADTAGNDRVFNGAMDEVAVFNYTLSAAQIADLYNQAAVPPTVTLTIERSGSDLILGWSQGTLQAAPAVTGPYTNVPTATAPSYTVPPTDAQMFYRVKVR